MKYGLGGVFLSINASVIQKGLYGSPDTKFLISVEDGFFYEHYLEKLVL